jgi:hypothetical protein
MADTPLTQVNIPPGLRRAVSVILVTVSGGPLVPVPVELSHKINYTTLDQPFVESEIHACLIQCMIRKTIPIFYCICKKGEEAAFYRVLSNVMFAPLVLFLEEMNPKGNPWLSLLPIGQIPQTYNIGVTLQYWSDLIDAHIRLRCMLSRVNVMNNNSNQKQKSPVVADYISSGPDPVSLLQRTNMLNMDHFLREWFHRTSKWSFTPNSSSYLPPAWTTPIPQYTFQFRGAWEEIALIKKQIPNKNKNKNKISDTDILKLLKENSKKRAVEYDQATNLSQNNAASFRIVFLSHTGLQNHSIRRDPRNIILPYDLPLGMKPYSVSNSIPDRLAKALATQKYFDLFQLSALPELSAFQEHRDEPPGRILELIEKMDPSSSVAPMVNYNCLGYLMPKELLDKVKKELSPPVVSGRARVPASHVPHHIRHLATSFAHTYHKLRNAPQMQKLSVKERNQHVAKTVHAAQTLKRAAERWQRLPRRHHR